MGDGKTEIDYAVVDACIAGIQDIIDDSYVSVALGRLRAEFDYSQSDYVTTLCEMADALGGINSIVNDLLFKSEYMLRLAKEIYSDTDIHMADSME